jgi:hypothetical protein
MNVRFNFLVWVFLLATSNASAERPPSEGWMGQMRGQSYFVAPNAGKHLGSEWDPEKKPAPLSVAGAIAAARGSLKKLVGGAEAKFACAEVKLSPVELRSRLWFYVVVFSSDDQTVITKRADSVQPASLPFVVYFDGFVVAPWRYFERL